MNTLLRIQVTVLAKQANAALRSVTSSIKAVQAAAAKMGAASPLGGMTRGLAATQAQVQQTGAALTNLGRTAAAGTGLTALGRLSQRVSGEMNRSRLGIIAMGKDLQWVGRQINFNFTLPLVFAGRAAMGLVLDVERAFTRLRKVYGETGKDYREELDKISHAMRLLSDFYGINQAEVMELAAQWAAAGAEGAELAKAVEASINLSILGDYETLSETFEGLVVIQGAYKLSTTQLAQAVAILNQVENKTAAQLPDLVTGIARAGSAAETAGTDIRELASMMAVLTPATGSAANAGNALKTIMSRLVSPTQETIDVLKELGITWSESFEAMTGTEKLQLLADSFADLTDSQKSYVSAIIAGRWHVNKFDVLLEDMANRAGTFHSVMKLIAEDMDMTNMQAANKEIATLLESDPRKLQILTTTIKNLMADAIIPLLPLIIGALTLIKQLFQWFADLPDPIQRAALGFLLFVAAIGVAAQMLGSVQLLFGTFLRFVIFTATLIPGLSLTTSAAVAATATSTTASVAAAASAQTATVAAAATAQVGILGRMAGALAGIGTGIFAALTSPWTLGIAAILGLMYVFRDQVTEIFIQIVNAITGAFNRLPANIQNAMIAVARVIMAAITQIREWLSYLNPFARHSPSLVDNVKAGVAVIAAQYARLAGFSGIFRKSAADLDAFAAATRNVVAANKANERGEQREKVVASGGPGAGAALDTLYADLDALQRVLDLVGADVIAQERVVNQLEGAYEAASRAVDQFDASMEPLRNTLSQIEAELSAAQTELDRFTNAPLVGMKAMNDQIFANEMAQKRLRLEMLRLGEAGMTLEEVQEKMAALNGDIEFLRAEMSSLQSSGAGSDITRVYEEQIAALEAQKDGLSGAADQSEALRQQLEELQRQGEILDLEKALQFDPLTRQIDELANATKELTFDEIVAGIGAQQQKIADLTAAYDTNKAALDAQQVTLDQLTATRDALKASYDSEQARLADLTAAYSAIEQEIKGIEDAINGVITAHDALAAAAAAGSPFDDLGGEFDTAPLPTFGEEMDLDALIKEWEDRLKDSFKIDLFGWIKDKWSEFKGWWNATLVPEFQKLWEYALENPAMVAAVGAAILSLFVLGIAGTAALIIAAIAGYLVAENWDAISQALSDGFAKAWEKVPFGDQIADAFAFLIEEFPGWLSDAWAHISEFGENLGSELEKWGELAGPLVEAMKHIKNVIIDTLKIIKVLMMPLLAGIGIVFKVGWEVLAKVVGPIFDGMSKFIVATLEGIRNFIAFILAVINGDWGAAWDALKGMVQATFDQISALVTMTVEVIVGVIKGLATAFADIFPWAVSAGGDIIAGLLKGLGDAVQGVWDWFSGFVNYMIDSFKALLGISSPSTVFAEIGVDILTGLLNGLIAGAVAVLEWFGGLYLQILGAIGDALTWLSQKGKDVLAGFLTGIVAKFIEVQLWLAGMGMRVYSAVGDFLLTLIQKGRDIVTGLWNGAKEIWTSLSTWIGGLGIRILNALPDLSQTLVNAGKALVDGFKSGIKSSWNTLATWWNENVGKWGFSIPGFDPPGPGPSFDGWKFSVPNMPKFHTGGIVQGPVGADVNATLRAGEMVLTGTQQRQLLAMASGGGTAQAVEHEDVKSYNFYGDLTFPNIRSADDAEAFLTNLEALAGAA